MKDSQVKIKGILYVEDYALKYILKQQQIIF
jgi:hypothetical protein